MSIRLTPSSTARRSTRRASPGSRGSPQIPSPVIRMAPKPRRLTVRGPSAIRPAWAAFSSVRADIARSSVEGGRAGAGTRRGPGKRVDPPPVVAPRPGRERTCVRVPRGGHPPCGPRRLLRVGRAARRPGPARAPGDRRLVGRDGRQLRGPGARRGRGMGGARARRLCPDAVVVPPRWEAYVEASRAVFDVFCRTSPVVEGLSIDEAFLDVRGHGAQLGHADRDRAAPAASGARGGRACPSPSGWPRPRASPRSSARSPSPTA